ncbi:MAG: Fe-Mn family superoxide dismutase, partial [Longimicrobiales bacterium]|nr:Fe-Mn family superoxide dismutase [Longimicrobiales bacterium]
GWLTMSGGKLKVYSTPNQDSPLMNGDRPILGVDVWEHAYYLHYQNARGDYVNAWWHVIDWDAVAERFIDAGG